MSCLPSRKRGKQRKKNMIRERRKEKGKGGKRIRTLAQEDVMAKKKAKTSNCLVNNHEEHHLKGERGYPKEDI